MGSQTGEAVRWLMELKRGKTLKAIAETVGMSVEGVRQRLMKLPGYGDIQAKSRFQASARSPNHTPERIEKVRRLWYRTDLSASEIGLKLGLTKNQIIRIAHTNGFAPRIEGKKGRP